MLLCTHPSPMTTTTTTNAVPHQNLTTTSIHIVALDGVVTVNSLFTLALFLGLASNPADPTYSLVSTTRCAASSSIAEDLVSFHVYSFGSFLFSSLIALGLKQGIKNSTEEDNVGEVVGVASVNLKVLTGGILASAVGSVLGCVFLMLAMVDLVQIKLGTFACEGWYGLAAVGPLVVLVPSALVIYICIVFHALTS